MLQMWLSPLNQTPPSVSTTKIGVPNYMCVCVCEKKRQADLVTETGSEQNQKPRVCVCCCFFSFNTAIALKKNATFAV